jgi:hypothetical protein
MFLSVIQDCTKHRDAVVTASCAKYCGLGCLSDAWLSYLRFLLVFFGLVTEVIIIHY